MMAGARRALYRAFETGSSIAKRGSSKESKVVRTLNALCFPKNGLSAIAQPKTGLEQRYGYFLRQRGFEKISVQGLVKKWRETISKQAQISAAVSNALFKAAKPIGETIKQSVEHKEAAGLRLEAFLRRNYVFLVGFAGIGSCVILWQIISNVAHAFGGISEVTSKFGFLAFAAATVTFSGLMLRARYSINSEKVYNLVMHKLNSSAGVIEVVGSPLSGTYARIYVMSGGRIWLKDLRPRLSRRRCFLMFPVQGSEKLALVSCEVVKKRGQYVFRLLAVDVPTSESDQRLFLIGDEEEYKMVGGIFSELRDPVLKAITVRKEFDAQDDEEDERKARQV